MATSDRPDQDCDAERRDLCETEEQKLELQGITNDVDQAKRELALELRRLLLTGFLRIDKRTVLYSV